MRRLLFNVVLIAVGAVAGYLVGRESCVADVRTRPKIYQISSRSSGPTRRVHEGTDHYILSVYSTRAFELVQMDIAEILRSLVGENSGRYHAYVLPASDGFTLTIHHDSDVPDLTDQQFDHLVTIVRRRLQAETAKWRREQ